jgi:hypothetical protein
MSVSVHDLQSTIDIQILEAVAAAHEISIHVHHRGRWIRGCRVSSLEQAIELAASVFERSGLPVQVRGQSGQPLFAINECGAVKRFHNDGQKSDSVFRPSDAGKKPVMVR